VIGGARTIFFSVGGPAQHYTTRGHAVGEPETARRGILSPTENVGCGGPSASDTRFAAGAGQQPLPRRTRQRSQCPGYVDDGGEPSLAVLAGPSDQTPIWRSTLWTWPFNGRLCPTRQRNRGHIRTGSRYCASDPSRPAPFVGSRRRSVGGAVSASAPWVAGGRRLRSRRRPVADRRAGGPTSGRRPPTRDHDHRALRRAHRVRPGLWCRFHALYAMAPRGGPNLVGSNRPWRPAIVVRWALVRRGIRKPYFRRRSRSGRS